MHGVQIGNSLVGYGAGAGQEKARLPLGALGHWRSPTDSAQEEEEKEERENIPLGLQGREPCVMEQSQVCKST